MPKQVVPLSARRIDTTKPSDKEQTLFDGGGLYLLISPQKFSIEGKPLPSSRGWRFKYRFGGKPCKISFGVYPDVGLEEARRRREAARTMIAEGINPSQERQQRRIEERRELVIDGNTFERIARQWYSIAKPQWVAEHARTVLSRLERDILPELGHRLIAEIKTVDVLAVLRLVEERGAFETAHRIKSIITQIFSFAIVTAIPEVEINPAAGLSKALKQPIKKSMAAIIDPIVLGRLLVDIERYPGSLIVRCALQLAPRLFVRPGELRHAKWSDVDLDGAVWR
nr:integrase arm-type DNA-binding domain-containing protein [Chlorobium sp.]